MLWVPRFFGGGYLPPVWWGPVNYNESVIFVGIVPLILALAALGRPRKPLALFFVALGLMGVLCACRPAGISPAGLVAGLQQSGADTHALPDGRQLIDAQCVGIGLAAKP